MAMSASALANALDAELSNFSAEPPARQAWANAYATYATDAAANGVPITGAAITAGKAAMLSGLTGMSAPGAFATVLQTAISAFWVAALGVAFGFSGAIAAIPPTGVTTIAAGLASILTANAAPGVTKTQALTNVATVIHAATIIGGTATFPPAVVSPIL